MKDIGAVVLLEICLWVLMPLFVIGCFFVFDLFRISQTWQQVALFISPLVIVAPFVWRRQNESAISRKTNTKKEN